MALMASTMLRTSIIPNCFAPLAGGCGQNLKFGPKWPESGAIFHKNMLIAITLQGAYFGKLPRYSNIIKTVIA
jgi:hypothetical protein